MGIFGDIFQTNDDTKKDTDNTDNTNKTSITSNANDATLSLRKEELDITKNSVQKGEVELSKEIVEEQKTVDVPITREEVVIERRSLNNEATDSPITGQETIRIPVNEEVVDVNKHTVIAEEISAHKHVIEDTAHIDETLRREEAVVNKIGNPDVVDNSNNNNTTNSSTNSSTFNNNTNVNTTDSGANDSTFNNQ